MCPMVALSYVQAITRAGPALYSFLEGINISISLPASDIDMRGF